MDQTNIPFDMYSKRTITAKGTRSVPIDKTKTAGAGGRATANLCVMADGSKLPVHMVYLGKRGGRIQTKELTKANRVDPQHFLATVQEAGWVDEVGMLEWIDDIWAPYIKSNSSAAADRAGKWLQMLDSFSVHSMASVRRRLNEVNTILILLPPGATSKVQVCDVGINRPFKHKLQILLNKWKMENIDNAAARVNRDVIREVVIAAWKNISSHSVVKTFKHIGFNI